MLLLRIYRKYSESSQITPTTVKIKGLSPQNCKANIKSSLQTSFITIFFPPLLAKGPHTQAQKIDMNKNIYRGFREVSVLEVL